MATPDPDLDETTGYWTGCILAGWLGGLLMGAALGLMLAGGCHPW